ncbi:hypothetical protein C2S52_001194 [Perilla frutescens var. hirtella]|nr:hypothetical protein C2S52_001194 [Perilla frutescens var. hirtella]
MAQEAWTRLREIFLDNKNSRIVTLEKEFAHTNIEDFPSASAYCQHLKASSMLVLEEARLAKKAASGTAFVSSAPPPAASPISSLHPSSGDRRQHKKKGQRAGSGLGQFSSPGYGPLGSTPSDHNGHLSPLIGHGSFHRARHPSALLALKHVLHVPDIVKNLVSLRKFTIDNSISVEFDPFGFSVKDFWTGMPRMRCESRGASLSGYVSQVSPVNQVIFPVSLYRRLSFPTTRSFGSTRCSCVRVA